MNNYSPEGGDAHQGGRGPTPSYQGNYNQRGQGSYNHNVQGNYHPHHQGDQRDYAPPPGQGNSGSGFNPAPAGAYGQGGGYRGHGTGAPYSQGQSHGSHTGSTEGQRFPQGDQRNTQEEERNYSSGGQTWNDQVRHLNTVNCLVIRDT